MRRLLLACLLALLAAPAAAQAPLPKTQCVSTAIASGTGDAIAIPLLPCVETTTLLILTITAANTVTNPTISVNGQTPHVILNFDAAPLTAGFLQPGQRRMLTYNGTNWLVLNSGGTGGGVDSISITGNPCIIATPNPITSTGTISTIDPLTVNCGGTGRDFLNAHSVLLGEGTNPVNSASTGTLGKVLTDNGPGNDPSFQAPPYDLGFSQQGAPSGSAVINLAIVRAANCATGFSGSRAYASIVPTGGVVVTVNQITSGITTSRGTITWSASGHDGAFASASGMSLSPNDVVQLVMPGSADASFADIGVTLKCTRTGL